MVLQCYQGKKWVINNKEANVVSLGLAEQLQALRQMNWIEMEDSSCNTNAYYQLCFITGKPTLPLKLHNVMVPNYLLLTIITTKDLASLEIIGYAIFTLVICRILTCLFKMIQTRFAFCSCILCISTRSRFLFVYTSYSGFPMALQNITLTTTLLLLICKTLHQYILPQS